MNMQTNTGSSNSDILDSIEVELIMRGFTYPTHDKTATFLMSSRTVWNVSYGKGRIKIVAHKGRYYIPKPNNHSLVEIADVDAARLDTFPEYKYCR